VEQLGSRWRGKERKREGPLPSRLRDRHGQLSGPCLSKPSSALFPLFMCASGCDSSSPSSPPRGRIAAAANVGPHLCSSLPSRQLVAALSTGVTVRSVQAQAWRRPGRTVEEVQRRCLAASELPLTRRTRRGCRPYSELLELLCPTSMVELTSRATSEDALRPTESHLHLPQLQPGRFARRRSGSSTRREGSGSSARAASLLLHFAEAERGRAFAQEQTVVAKRHDNDQPDLIAEREREKQGPVASPCFSWS
jgi:hypothetical protein